MTKQDLEQLRKLPAEIKAIQDDIDNIPITTDSVTGSRLQIPFDKHSGAVEGMIIEESMRWFEKAIQDCDTVPEDFKKAIRITKNNAELCEKISWWCDGLWGLVEEFLNTHPENIEMEYFEHACGLLEDGDTY